jgi:hypothetical protein
LKVQYDRLLQSYAFSFNLRRYNSVAAPPACLMRPAAVGVLGRVLSAGDPGLRAGALILLGLIAKEGTR